MQGINFIDYIGVTVLAIIYKNVSNHKGEIKFCSVPHRIKKIFSIVGLNRVLQCYNLEEAALNSFREDKNIAKIPDKKLRRKFDRIPFNNSLEYKLKFSHQNVFYKAKIVNLSAIGMFVMGEKLFSVGEILLVKMYLLPQPDIVEVEAKIIWVSADNINLIEYSAMGIEFCNLSSEKQRIIIAFVDKKLASREF